MAVPRRAAFLAVGSELLGSERSDSNSLLAARLLRRCSFAFSEKRTVEDDADAIATAVRELAARAELVLVSGGLGPTADDVTREGVARAFGLSLARHAALEGALVARYRSTGRPMPGIALRMADVIEGAEILPNPQGTAPGQLVQAGDCVLVLLPGVPGEFETILTTHVLPRFGSRSRVAVRTLHLGGVYESAVEERVSPLYDRWGRERVTILASRGQVDLVLTAAGERAEQELAVMEADFAAAAGADLFGRDEQTLAGVVLERARQRGWRLATAESCTGGLIGAKLTAVAGASEVYAGGVVAYADAVKRDLLGVPGGLLEAHGAVSGEVAEAMARGLARLGAECGVAVTGIAGPSGGSAEKPVGTVFMATLTPAATNAVRYRFPGNRGMVRELAATYALDLLRRSLEGR